MPRRTVRICGGRAVASSVGTERCENAVLEVILGDITQLRVDAIVNAGNTRLLGGGGVDGSIHRAAGPELLQACRAIAEVRPGVRCPTGEARITAGFDLPARYVIHTVGPVWGAHEADEADRLLAACYRSALSIAREWRLQSIAFPCISTGVYGYPPDRAADIAVATARDADQGIERVVFACFLERDHALYRDRITAPRAPRSSQR